jgi:hypothetical protein
MTKGTNQSSVLCSKIRKTQPKGVWEVLNYDQQSKDVLNLCPYVKHPNNLRNVSGENRRHFLFILYKDNSKKGAGGVAPGRAPAYQVWSPEFKP